MVSKKVYEIKCGMDCILCVSLRKNSHVIYIQETTQ